QPAELLLTGHQARHLPAEREGERDVVEAETRDLLAQVGLARDVARAPGRDGDAPAVAGLDLEPEPLEPPTLLGRIELDPDQLVRALGAEAHDWALRELCGHLPLAGPPSPRQ